MSTGPAAAPLHATAAAPFQSLAVLRDLPLRVQLSDALALGVAAFVQRASPPLEAGLDAQQGLLRDGLALVEQLIAALDVEGRKITEEMVSANHRMNSHGTYATQLQGDVTRLLQDSKTKLDDERQKFGQRYAKQHQNTLDALKTTIDGVETCAAQEEFGLVYTLSESYRRSFERWATNVFAQWAAHTASLLQDRATKAIEGTLPQLMRLLGTPIAFVPPAATEPAIPQGLDIGKCEERAEMPSWGESYKESLFTGLNQVAMLASLVIVPVVGNFSHEQPVTHAAHHRNVDRGAADYWGRVHVGATAPKEVLAA